MAPFGFWTAVGFFGSGLACVRFGSVDGAVLEAEFAPANSCLCLLQLVVVAEKVEVAGAPAGQ